ncbi:hypothetical protein T01_317 [Trichinella spiralis]|uniref:Uncharacterized protein n=1 Tax=Trichinella spiralis TaxID=6334 RepID=A0A0V1B8L5_TRISP|nr:hypothetical protein T01_317 [Trichinella spiralis]
MVLYPKLQCSVSITVLSTERVNCILFEIFKWYLCCNQNMKVKRFSDFSIVMIWKQMQQKSGMCFKQTKEAQYTLPFTIFTITINII